MKWCTSVVRRISSDRDAFDQDIASKVPRTQISEILCARHVSRYDILDLGMCTVLPRAVRGRGNWLLLRRLRYDDEGEGPGSGQRMKVQCMMEVGRMIW
jgi:hypothetical protein